MTIEDGGYDDGYKSCPCFWGTVPGSLVSRFIQDHSVANMNVLDAGCGEGKNAVALAKLRAKVTAIDCSVAALENARNSFAYNNVEWCCGDIRTFNAEERSFELVIAYGLMHCLQSRSEIQVAVRRLQKLTVRGGWNILCAFNDREHDLSAHPGFNPCLLPHTEYVKMYEGWEIDMITDEDLYETHPHNNIPHTHSMTRLIARKAS